MKRVFTAVMVSLLLAVMLPTSGIHGHEPTRIPDPVFDPSLGPDVPVWSKGDYWNYTTDITYDLGLVSLDLSGWLNMSVVAITLDLFSDGDPVYILNITGNISGEDTFPFVGEVKIFINLTGYIWSRCQDLAHYRSILNASVSGTVSSINGNYPLGYEYSPPLEEYDFPLIEGEKWRVDTTAAFPFGAGDIVDIGANYSCATPRTISVDAGTFEVFPVSINGSESLYFNGTVGNSILRTFTVPAGTSEVEVPFELSSFKRKQRSIDVSLSINEEQQVEAGSNFTLHGELSSSNVIVNVFFPKGRLAATQTLLISDRDFDIELKAPMFPDDTPTNIDHGSFGIIVVINAVQSTGVITVTTKARDLEVLEGDLVIIPRGNGTVDDVFDGYLNISNPSNFSVQNFSLKIEIEGGKGYPRTIDGLSIEGHGTREVTFQIEVNLSGNYTAVAILDPDDEVVEYNETNNRVSFNFSVKVRPDILWQTEPEERYLDIEEGEDVELYAIAERDGVEIPGEWTYKGEPVGTKNRFNFLSEFTGPNSSVNSPFNFTYMLDENLTYPGEKVLFEFSVNVSDLNRAPMISSLSPNAAEVRVREGISVNFSVEAYDPDGDDIFFSWLIDGSVHENDLSWMVIETNYTGWYSNDHPLHGIQVTVRDGKGDHIHTSWLLNISDLDRPFEVELDPDVGGLTVLINETLELSFSAADPDGTLVASTWSYLNESYSNSTTLTIDPDEMGLEIGDVFEVVLRLSSGGLNKTFGWNITVNTTVEPPVIEPVPIKGLRIVEPVNRTFLEGENITFRAASDEDRTIYYTWHMDGNSYNMTSVTINSLEPGNHTVVLVAKVLEGIPGSANLTFEIEIVEKREPDNEEPEKEEEEDDPMWWLPLIISLFIIIVILIAFALFLRKNREEDLEWED